MEQLEPSQKNELLDQKQAKKILSRAGFALFFTALAVLISQLILEFLFKKIFPSATKANWYVWFITAVSMILIGLPLFWLLTKRIPSSPKGEVIKLKPIKFIMIFFICAAAMYITNLFSSLLTMAIAYLKGDTQLLNPVADAMINSNRVISFLYASLAAPIIEELIFRKLLLDKLRRFGDVPAILMTGIAFGLFHMNLSQMFYAATLGFIFAYITIKTNTIRYSILLHIMVNFIGTAVAQTVFLHSTLISMMVGQWVFLCIVAGIICLVFNLKSIKFTKAENLPIKKSTFFLNPGTILYVLVCTVMIIAITLS